MDDEGTTGAARRPPGDRRRNAAFVLAAVVLAGLWPLAWSRSNGGTDALLGAGTEGPSAQIIAEEIPDAPAFEGLGHDGQQFYAIARHPFDPPAARDQLDSPAYRYRRILLPAMGAAAAPDGGSALVLALLAISLAGVALGAWASTRLPGAPQWLPLAVGATPGVGVALSLTLSDALATGLTIAAIAASLHRRWAWMLLALVAGVLTRETLILVAFGLLLTPHMPTRWRVATVVVPAGAIGAWALWSAHALGTPLLDGAGQVALPFTGWLAAPGTPASLLIGVLTMVILGLGTWRSEQTAPGVAAVLGLHLLLLACLATDVTGSWVNTTRVAAPVMAVAVWSTVRAPAEATTSEATSPSTARRRQAISLVRS